MRSKLPTWVLAAAAALIGLLIYAGMYFYASSAADETAQEIQSLTTMTR
jgi:type VI secretion system protein ImpK